MKLFLKVILIEMRFQELFKEKKNNLDDDIQQGIVQKQDDLGLI